MPSVRLLIAVALVAATPLAAQKPVQLALFTPVQIVPETEAVTAFRLNVIYSKNTAVSYVDLGLLVNITTSGESTGIQWAAVSIAEGSFTGWQSGFVDRAAQGKGLQWGAVNMSDNWEGLQLGVVNYAQNLNGVQIGLVNIIKQGGVLPVLPIVNWSF